MVTGIRENEKRRNVIFMLSGKLSNWALTRVYVTKEGEQKGTGEPIAVIVTATKPTATFGSSLLKEP
jgi:hypothetical protein